MTITCKQDSFSIFCRACTVISPIIGIEWVIKGEEYLSKDESLIVMANHQSALDILGEWLFFIWIYAILSVFQ